MDKKQIIIYQNKYKKTLEYLRTKKNILFITTSNRWIGETTGEEPKSTLLAKKLMSNLAHKVTLIDVSKLKIYPCEGNVSTSNGNTCGVKKALLINKKKNPTGWHRCWASLNNSDDELWQVSKKLFSSDCVVFFSSVRWGQMNSEYQKLIERLTWIENRHSTLGETNIVKNIDAGVIIVGQNWRGTEIVTIQKQVLKYFGFKVKNQLCWNWQYTNFIEDETDESYIKAAQVFKKTFRIK